MNILILQHTATEGPGGVLDWCAKQNANITYIDLYRPNPQFDATKTYHLMVILGGSMSVNDESELPWLKAEKKFVRQMLEAKTPILGICLGAQMIATALGVKVSSNIESEIGWHPVCKTLSEKSVFQLPEIFEVFHWHNETFELPPNAIQIAQSEACFNQGYQIGDRVIGLQFHPEVTLNIINLWIEKAGDSLNSGSYVQGSDKMLALAKQNIPFAHALLHRILDYLVGKK